MAKKKTDEAAQRIKDAIENSPEVKDAIEESFKDIIEAAEEERREIDETLSSVGTSREELIKRLSSLGVGSDRQLYSLSELYKSFRHYKDEVPEGENVIEYILREYRDKVGKFGYLGIKKEMIPTVQRFGTIKDIAALCTLAYYDMEQDKDTLAPKAPLLSRKKTDEIRNEIRSRGRAAMVEFMNCLSLYETLHRNFHNFYGFQNTYTSTAYQTAIYLNTHEWLCEVEELFNSLAPLVPEDKLRPIAEKYNDFLIQYQRFGELDETRGDGWIDKQKASCLKYAERLAMDLVSSSLAELKGHIVAIRLWIKKNKAEMFVPMELRNQIAQIEQGCISEIHSKYYSSYLIRKEEQGGIITEADRQRAILPEYEDIEPDENAKKYTLEKLDGYKETFK